MDGSSDIEKEEDEKDDEVIIDEGDKNDVDGDDDNVNDCS